MSKAEINWQKVSLSFSSPKESAEEFFERKINEYLDENSSYGLDGGAVLDKCINILIDLLADGIIKSCSGVNLENESGNCTFYFDCVLPGNPEEISVGVKLEVGE